MNVAAGDLWNTVSQLKNLSRRHKFTLVYDPKQEQRKKEVEERQIAAVMKESLEEEPKGEPEKNPFAKSRPSFIKDASEKLKKK